MIVGEQRGDSNNDYANQAGNGQQASKGNGSTRIKFSIERREKTEIVERNFQSFKNDQARESENKSRETAIKLLERVRLPHDPQYDSLGYRPFKQRPSAVPEDSPLELCLDTQNADGEFDEKVIQGSKDKQELEEANDKREIEQELELIEKDHTEVGKKSEAARGEDKRAETADSKQDQKGAKVWSKWQGKSSSSQPSDENELAHDESQY